VNFHDENLANGEEIPLASDNYLSKQLHTYLLRLFSFPFNSGECLILFAIGTIDTINSFFYLNLVLGSQTHQ